MTSSHTHTHTRTHAPTYTGPQAWPGKQTPEILSQLEPRHDAAKYRYVASTVNKLATYTRGGPRLGYRGLNTEATGWQSIVDTRRVSIRTAYRLVPIYNTRMYLSMTLGHPTNRLYIDFRGPGKEFAVPIDLPRTHTRTHTHIHTN